MDKFNVIGLDTAKSIFHLVELHANGKELACRQLRRSQLLRRMANLKPTTIAMEACSSSHYWGRRFREMGHQVVLLPAQHIKGYLRGQKNDYNDARAIAEACLHGRIRSVQVKSVEQQDLQALHRSREQLKKSRNQLANQIRGFLRERGVIVAVGLAPLRNALPEILESPNEEVTVFIRELLARDYRRLKSLDEEIDWHDRQLRQQAKASDVCKRLCRIPGIGPVVSTAFANWVGDGQQFQRGRDASAALGLVPRQHTTGGKPKLGGISKRGDRYLRALLVHGARSVVKQSDRRTDSLSQWINRLKARHGVNKATVALANKITRIAWVVVAREENYRPAEALCS
ncbi:IS110 family transposase [Pseudomaricurvus alcaniphilus]|uniref:IS110 family transposase n=1 Tax=Pseudomaricurvus alcaniphilus TaxID=1166482 RepID=UPI00140BFC05|nr:IS110 family transposase [Pseudomaricurvus alcaniphilus]NHN40016.1 IS110 family transposase [Pseudomaricurvus alcaniphilus]